MIILILGWQKKKEIYMHATNKMQHVPVETTGLYSHLVVMTGKGSVDCYLMNRSE